MSNQDSDNRFHGELETPQCWMCINLTNGTCKAFPNSIPAIIYANEFDHRRPFPGDNGIRFAPLDDAAAEGNEKQWSAKIARWKWLLEDDDDLFDDERSELKANIEKFGSLWDEGEDEAD